MILAIDPGPEHSAFVLYVESTRTVARFGKVQNDALVRQIADLSIACPGSVLVVEMIASYGMPVGREVFDTCVWIGRFEQAWQSDRDRLYRTAIKTHLCGTPRAKDGNVRQALIDAFGGKAAVGTKRQPGPLYGVSGDVWSALAVAVTYADRQEQARAA